VAKTQKVSLMVKCKANGEGKNPAGSGVANGRITATASTIKQSSPFGERAPGGTGRNRDDSCRASGVSLVVRGGSSTEVWSCGTCSLERAARRPVKIWMPQSGAIRCCVQRIIE